MRSADQIIDLVGWGRRNQHIADALGLSEADLKIHLSRIYAKLGVDDRLDLAIYAHRYGLTTFRPATQLPLFPVEQPAIEREMRCVTLLAYILPQRAREEWLGDLIQSRHDLVHGQYAWWKISLMTWSRVALLFWSLIKVKYDNLSFKNRNE